MMLRYAMSLINFALMFLRLRLFFSRLMPAQHAAQYFDADISDYAFTPAIVFAAIYA